ncbi:MAG TPA: DEAD/DEAH box helicase [Bacteroidia bacterium]|nr:DEAD/DEAH box helicase [Bacteroidia bacterium]
MPQKKTDYESAKKRFAYEEIFYIQLVRGIEKKEYAKSGAYIFEPTKIKEEKIMEQLGFELTSAQEEVMDSIKKDFKSDIPMSRLLEGDVGSGKTVIAAITAYFAATTRPKGQSFGHTQVAYMAPTEILAKQIFSEFQRILGPLGITLGLLTSKDVRKFPSKIDRGEVKVSKKKLLD